jgi:hypothetical protein
MVFFASFGRSYEPTPSLRRPCSYLFAVRRRECPFSLACSVCLGLARRRMQQSFCNLNRGGTVKVVTNSIVCNEVPLKCAQLKNVNTGEEVGLISESMWKYVTEEVAVEHISVNFLRVAAGNHIFSSYPC